MASLLEQTLLFVRRCNYLFGAADIDVRNSAILRMDPGHVYYRACRVEDAYTQRQGVSGALGFLEDEFRHVDGASNVSIEPGCSHRILNSI